MDRNTVIGFVLIAVVIMVWMYMNAPTPTTQPTSQPDTASHVMRKPDTTHVRENIPPPAMDADSLGTYFTRFAGGKEQLAVIETDLYRATISSKGGGVRSWMLKDFKTWNQYPVDLLGDPKAGELGLVFLSHDGKLIRTRNLYFSSVSSLSPSTHLAANDSMAVRFEIRIPGGGRIIKTLTFYGNRYSFDVVYGFEGLQNVIGNYEYQVTWETGLSYAERNSVDESGFAHASAFAGGELTEIDASSVGERVEQSISGRVDWVATRNKYFVAAIIPRTSETSGAFLEGTRVSMPDNGFKEAYGIALKMRYVGQQLEQERFTVYLGPLEFGTVKSLGVGLDKMMSLGAAWIIRPISEYVIIPVVEFLHMFIPNYGIVLIVIAILIKIALHPLTRTSMRSMQKMQQLQPMMNEIREKYKSDPQKMNQQVMRLYKEYGVNPAGGCLPMLLQLPILYALYSVFRSAIELRQASFFWWITDLSIPDVMATLPFRLPIFHINEISGLALLLGITTFLQQKMSVKDPRQKMLVYMMPVMMVLLFNSFPAGLNLYYLVFNILSIGQQMWVNKQHAHDPLRKVEEKKKSGGIIGRLSKDMPKIK